MAASENIVLKISADTSNYTTKLAAASSQAQQFGKSLDSSASTGAKVKGVLSSIAIGAGALSLAVGVKAVQAYTQFDQAMSGVSANVAERGTASFEALKKAAIDAGARTQYSATESANAINELGKAGVSTKDILAGGLNGALNLAASGQMDVAEAAELTASTLNQFGLEGSKASHVADLLAAGANAAQGGVGDLGEALNNVGVNAHQLGMHVEEVTGALTLMAAKGKVGGEAGTELNAMLQSLAAPTNAASKAMDELGLNMYDSNGHFISMSALAGQLHDKMGNLSEAERNEAMNRIFTNAGMKAANILYEAGAKGVSKYTKEIDKNGYAQQQASQLTDNLAGDVEQLGGSLETVFIQIGQGANGPLRGLTQGLTGLINGFGALPAPVQQGIVLTTGLAGGFAALDRVMTSFTQNGGKSASVLNSVINPMQRLRDATPALSAGFKDIFSAATGVGISVDGMSNSVTRGQKVMSGLKNTGSGLVSLMGGPWGIAITAAAVGLNFLAQKSQEAKAHQESLTNSFKQSANAAAALGSAIKNNSSDLWSDDAKSITGLNNITEALKKAGVSQREFTDAVTGSDKAYKAFSDKLVKSAKTSDDGSYTVFSSLAEQASKARDSFKESEKAIKDNAVAQEAQQKASVKAGLAQAGLTDALQDNANATAQAAKASDILAQAFGATNKGVDAQATALNEVVEALQTYYGFALNADEANLKWEDSIRAANDGLKQNGANLDATTEKGSANLHNLQSLASAAMSNAKAMAQNGASSQELGDKLDSMGQSFIDVAQRMGMSQQDAQALAQKYGLTRSSVNDLVDSLNKLPKNQQIKVEAQIDQANQAIDELNLKVAQDTKDPKKFVISGDNQEAKAAIAEVLGLEIPPKNGNLTLDKNQFDIAMAIAQGAKIDPKTGKLLGDNSEYWQKIAAANGWTIDKKTGVISGNNGEFKAAKKAVDDARIADKTVKVGANAGGFWNTMNSILGSVFNVNVGVSGQQHRATGGLVIGPGTGTSDSIPAMLSNGEYVMTAKTVRKYGVGYLNQLNYGKYAEGGLVQKAQSVSTVITVPNDLSPLTGKIEQLRDDISVLARALMNTSIMLDDREMGRMVRKYI